MEQERINLNVSDIAKTYSKLKYNQVNLPKEPTYIRKAEHIYDTIKQPKEYDIGEYKYFINNLNLILNSDDIHKFKRIGLFSERYLSPYFYQKKDNDVLEWEKTYIFVQNNLQISARPEFTSERMVYEFKTSTLTNYQNLLKLAIIQTNIYCLFFSGFSPFDINNLPNQRQNELFLKRNIHIDIFLYDKEEIYTYIIKPDLKLALDSFNRYILPKHKELGRGFYITNTGSGEKEVVINNKNYIYKNGNLKQISEDENKRIQNEDNKNKEKHKKVIKNSHKIIKKVDVELNDENTKTHIKEYTSKDRKSDNIIRIISIFLSIITIIYLFNNEKLTGFVYLLILLNIVYVLYLIDNIFKIRPFIEVEYIIITCFFIMYGLTLALYSIKQNNKLIWYPILILDFIIIIFLVIFLYDLFNKIEIN